MQIVSQSLKWSPCQGLAGDRLSPLTQTLFPEAHKMITESWRAADGLHLATLALRADVAPPSLPPSVHRIFFGDCSGSMSSDLASVRQHLKNNLSQTVAVGDTVTIGWFSGRGQFGVIVEGIRIRDLVDLSAVHAAIDRYLRPVGLTGFKEPLEEVERVISRLRAADPSYAFSLCFMSDGHDNQWSRKEILGVCERLGPSLASSAVVEYGWYANRPLLVAMAEAMGGEYVFAEDFSRFAPVLDTEFSRRVDGVRKREMRLPCAPLHGVAFAARGAALATYAVGPDLCVRVPEDVRELHFLSGTPVGDQKGDLGRGAGPEVAGAYAALVVLSQRMQADDTLRVLKALGDVRLIRRFASCYGKQQYSAFQEAAAAAAQDPGLRWAEGHDPSMVPAEDAYTILDLLADLMEEDANLLHLTHPSFVYQRIGRKTVSSAGLLTAEEQAEISGLTSRARSATDLEAVQRRIAEIVSSKPKAASFRAMDRDAGVPFANVTLNESRPNVSLLTRQDGVVEVGENDHGVPTEVASFIWRNWTIVRDGILNVKTLPVSLGRDTFSRLAERGMVDGPYVDGAVYELALDGLPIVNRQMVKRVSAKDCFRLQFEVARAKAAQKVFKHYEEQHFPKERAQGLKDCYGADAAEWLKSMGVTDGGFSPKVVQAEASDVYVGRELKIALKGLSSLPKIEDVAAKLDGGKKLTASDALVAPFLEEVRQFLASPIYLGAANPEALLKTWLVDKSRHWVSRVRELNRQLSEIKFSIIVGQVWFPEFESLDEGTLVIDVDGTQVQASASIRDIEVEV